MAFPTVSATATGGSATDVTTTHPVNIPAGNEQDALLIVVFVSDGTATVTGWPANWLALQVSELGGTSIHRWEIRYKLSAGGETNFNLTTSAAESSASITWLIKGWDKFTAPALGTTVKATIATPNPPALDPTSWGVEDTLWLAVQGWDDGRTNSTAAPASYSGLVVSRPNTGATGVGAAGAWRNNAIASEDPGTFTNSASDPTMANTLAIRPGIWPAEAAAQSISAAPRFLWY